MSKISLEPNDSGAGTFSIVSPDSNTNRTLNLPDESGTIFSDGTGVPGSSVIGQLASSNMPAGSVIQVVNSIYDPSNAFVTTSSSLVKTDLQLSITPKVLTSKIFVVVNATTNARNRNEGASVWNLALFRNDSLIYLPDGPFSTKFTVSQKVSGVSGLDIWMPETLTYIDEPNTTSSVEYSLYMSLVDGESARMIDSEITLMEIAG